MDFNYLETLGKTFIIPAGQNQFIQQNSFKKFSVRQIAIAKNRNSTFSGLHTKNQNPFWYQPSNLTQIRKLGGVQPIVDFVAADNCCLYVTTIKAMNIHDDTVSIPIDIFKDQYVLVFDLTSMQDASKDFHYPELVEEPLRLELKFTLPLELLISLYW